MQQGQRITIEIIEGKDFHVRSNGYDADEVDTFLDDICDEMERQEMRMVEMEKQLTEAQGEVLKYRNGTARAVQVKPASASDVQDMLEYAQRIKNEVLEKAEQQAQTIVAEAQKKIESQMGDLIARRDALQEEIRSLKEAAEDYRARFTALVDEQRALLDKAGL